MTVRVKCFLIFSAFVCANLAIYGAKQILSGLYDPVVRSLGA